MKEESRLLFGILGTSCLLALGACLLANWADRGPRVCSESLAHVEIHADRPLPEVIREYEIEHETPDQREVRETREARDRDLAENGV